LGVRKVCLTHQRLALNQKVFNHQRHMQPDASGARLIKKQEFYEGAALYQLMRTNAVERVAYAQPFFILNDRIAVLLKYSTSKDSPWNFAFTEAELIELRHTDLQFKYYSGLVCGSDGVVTLSREQILQLVGDNNSNVRVGCYRRHDQHYQVNGPTGPLSKKVSRADWTRMLLNGEANATL
jgi:hypothetical protein